MRIPIPTPTPLFALALGAALAAPAGAACPEDDPGGRLRYELRTELGDVCIELLDQPGEANITSAYFRNYADRGWYDRSFIHRSVPDFVIQGGGFRWEEFGGYQRTRFSTRIRNEPGIPNTRGTLAMAKVGGDPDSATNQWFVNLVDNPGLDTDNGGFTVFARVVGSDMDIVDAIAALHTEYGPFAVQDPFAAAFSNLPVLSLLERDPAGYGCVIVEPDPLPDGTPRGTHTCISQAEFDASIELTREAMDPQVPERLVVVEAIVYAPEPGAAALAGVGAFVLGAAALRRRRR